MVANLAARDIRSNLGSNLALLREETGLDPWTVGPEQLKKALIDAEVVEVPRGEEWRIQYLEKLLEQYQLQHYLGNIDEEEKLKCLIDSLVIN